MVQQGFFELLQVIYDMLYGFDVIGLQFGAIRCCFWAFLVCYMIMVWMQGCRVYLWLLQCTHWEPVWGVHVVCFVGIHTVLRLCGVAYHMWAWCFA